MKGKVRFLFSVFGLALMLAPTTCYAADDNSLTSLFRAEAFSGSMEVISKLNWTGWLLNGIISVFCLVGLFLTVFRIITSLMYLSGRNVFDKIHEIKSANQGEFFGLKSLFSNTIHGNGDTGSGIDTFIYFFLGLLPDVKMYSDFADGKEAKGVSADTTITEYVLKISLPTIMTVFFLSIGFSGVLWQMFGTVVDGLSVAAEKIADTNLETCVRRLLNTDAYYQFSFGDDGTKWGALQDNTANRMYSELIKHSKEDPTGEMSLVLGKVVAGYFNDGKALSRKNIARLAGVEGGEKDESEARNVKIHVRLNSQKEKMSPKDVLIPVDDIVSKTANECKYVYDGNSKLYLHVTISRKNSAINGNYYSVNTSEKHNPNEEGTGVYDENAVQVK